MPSSYSVDGVQYLAVQSGWGVYAQRMQDSLDTARGTKTDVPPGGVIWMFAIKKWTGRAGPGRWPARGVGPSGA